jgi:hypothetical protein
MPIRTRAQMHIGLDLGLSILNSNPTNRLDPVIKDFFLNRTISEFVKTEISKGNKPDENKRVPFRILTYGDIINKYNNLRTLIKIKDDTAPDAEIDTSFRDYTLPTDLFRFETSYSIIKPIECNNVTYVTLPNPLLDTYDIISFNNNPYGGKRKYIGTILVNNKLRVYHLGRYTFNKLGMIYIAKSAVLTSSPIIVDCDLPDSVHDTIIDDTVKFISAAVSSGNYQQLLMEAKSKNQ